MYSVFDSLFLAICLLSVNIYCVSVLSYVCLAFTVLFIIIIILRVIQEVKETMPANDPSDLSF